MFVVMGASGNVGGAVARSLLESGERVLAVTRDPQRVQALTDRGAEVAIADADHPDGLRAVLRRGRRAFLLDPLGDVAGDIDADQRRTGGNILRALDGSGLEKVVLASTYGAQQGNRIGDLGTLWELEEGLRSRSVPAAVNRGAYYMSNWAMVVDGVQADGVLTTMLPQDLRIPMVAPADLGAAAADRLRTDLDDVGTAWIEGPEEYSVADVAAAFAAALGREVRVEVVPQEQWVRVFEQQGFSKPAAESFAGMTALTLTHREQADRPIRGATALEDFIRALVARGPRT